MGIDRSMDGSIDLIHSLTTPTLFASQTPVTGTIVTPILAFVERDLGDLGVRRVGVLHTAYTHCSFFPMHQQPPD